MVTRVVAHRATPSKRRCGRRHNPTRHAKSFSSVAATSSGCLARASACLAAVVVRRRCLECSSHCRHVDLMQVCCACVHKVCASNQQQKVRNWSSLQYLAEPLNKSRLPRQTGELTRWLATSEQASFHCGGLRPRLLPQVCEMRTAVCCCKT